MTPTQLPFGSLALTIFVLTEYLLRNIFPQGHVIFTKVLRNCFEYRSEHLRLEGFRSPTGLRSCRVRTRLGALTHSSDHVLALERKGEATAVSVVLCPGRLSCRGQSSSIRGALPASPSPAPVLIPGICALTLLSVGLPFSVSG